MNNIDELYGHQWNEQLQHEYNKYEKLNNYQWVSCDPEDELIEELYNINKSVPADIVFKSLIDKYGKESVLLRGAAVRDGNYDLFPLKQ